MIMMMRSVIYWNLMTYFLTYPNQILHDEPIISYLPVKRRIRLPILFFPIVCYPEAQWMRHMINKYAALLNQTVESLSPFTVLHKWTTCQGPLGSAIEASMYICMYVCVCVCVHVCAHEPAHTLPKDSKMAHWFKILKKYIFKLAKD